MFQGEGMGTKGPWDEKGKQSWTWEVGVCCHLRVRFDKGNSRRDS